jgi:hypothetical protein
MQISALEIYPSVLFATAILTEVGLVRWLVRSLLAFMVLFILFGASMAMYANASAFASVPDALRDVNATIALTSQKTQTVISTVQPIAADYNIAIPRSVINVNKFLKDSARLISNATDAGSSAAVTAKALGTLPWVLPLITAFMILPFIVRAWRGFAKVTIVLAVVSLFLIILLMAPFTLVGFISTGECANNVRQGLINYVNASTSDSCSTDVIQFYLLCVRPLNVFERETKSFSNGQMSVGPAQSHGNGMQPRGFTASPNQQGHRRSNQPDQSEPK